MRLVVLASCLVLAAGCGGRTPTTGLAAEIPGTTWSLERVVLPDGGVLRGDADRVTFAADGSVNVSSCNTCNGRYRLRGERLEIEPLACTRRACPTGDVELERYLSGPLTLRRDGAYLVLDAMGEAGTAGPQVLLVPADG